MIDIFCKKMYNYCSRVISIKGDTTLSIDTELKIAIVDDIDSDRSDIMKTTQEILELAHIPNSILCYPNGKALLDDMRSGKRFHLLLLDVLLDEMDGMELAQEIRDQGNQTMIVFISISQEMARRGYRVDASRYLVKPLDREELKEALMHCHEKWQTKKEILLPTDQGQYRTSFPDIQFVEAFDRGTRFALTDKTVETKIKFSEVEGILPKSTFVLCHRAYIVNLAQAKHIRQYEFTMSGGNVVPISRLRYGEVNRKFVEYFTE